MRRPVQSLILLGFLLATLSSACQLQPLFPIVKIGLIAPFEGRYRDIGYDAIYAARLAVREINAAGGIYGRRLALVAYDDRNDPELARTLARNLSVDPDVFAVIGHYRQETTTAAQEIYLEEGIPLLAIGAWPTPTTSSLGGQLAPSLERLTDAVIDEVPLDAEQRCGTIWGGGPLTQPLLDALGEQVCSGTDVAPAFVLNAAPAHVAGASLQAQRSAGWTGVVIGGPALSAQDFVDVGGAEVVDGTSFLTPYPFPDDLSNSGAWIEAYKRMGPHVPEPGPYALPTYEAIYFFAEAFADAVITGEPPTQTGVAHALRRVTRVGALGQIHLSERGIWQDVPLYLYTWRAGEPQLTDLLSP